jgi:SET domain-containing protein
MVRIRLCGYYAVIDSDECEKRLWEYKNEGTEHFYLMEIGSDLIIDAGRSGNMARFINHSCAPNLVAQKWKVKNGP